VIVGLSIVIAQSVQSQSEPKKEASSPAAAAQDESKPGPGADRSADEAAIRANIAAFAKAYDAGDAKAIAALFTPEAYIVGKEGNTTQGREGIAQTFADIFKNKPEKKIEVEVGSIRFLGPDLAIEVGKTKETYGPDEPPEYDSYTVLHVKRDGKWQMALARDEEGPLPTPHDRLRPLSWMVGEWIDDGGSAVVRSTCRWSEDKMFLLQEFKLQISGQDAMNVSQRIGWDPLSKRVRSWVFDSEGGYGESVWTFDDDEDDWIIKATGVRPDGTTASATNILSQSGPDGYVFRSTDRVVGDDRQPDLEVKVVRKPPDAKK
jgi:uncharacterized protein (TIGR02246 family)